MPTPAYYLDQTGNLFKADGTAIPVDGNNANYQTYLQYIAYGKNPAAVYTLNRTDLASSLRSTLNAQMDAVAIARGYSSLLEACSYANSTVEQYAAEGWAALVYRDAVRQYMNTALAQFDSNGTAPSMTTLVAGMPTISWP